MEDPVSENKEEELSMHRVEGPSPHPTTVDMIINGKCVRMEVDTGAAVTIISEPVKDACFLQLCCKSHRSS